VRPRINDVRKVRRRTLEMLEPLTQAELDARETADRWSPGQIADHLIKANRMYLGEIHKLIALKRAGKRPEIYVRLSEMQFEVPFLPRFLMPLADVPVGLFNTLLPASLRELFLRSPILPAQAPAVLRPEAGRRREDLLADLRQTLEETERLFVDHGDVDLSELRYYHPLFGFNGLDGILGLMASHEERHQKQLAQAVSRVARVRSNAA
jgi:hypothetical protein